MKMLEDVSELEEILTDCNIDIRHLYKVREFYEISTNVLGFRSKIYDLCCGNGLFGFFYSINNPYAKVRQVDIKVSNKYLRLRKLLEKRFNLDNCQLINQDIRKLNIDEDYVLYAIHGCGDLTKVITDLAVRNRLPFSVLPCCQIKNVGKGLSEERNLARIKDYQVVIDYINGRITRKNKVISGKPLSS